MTNEQNEMIKKFKAIYSRKKDGKWRECNSCESHSICVFCGCSKADLIEKGQ